METPKKLIYPSTKKVSQTDDYFGTKVEDPYRWLENDTSAETSEWVKRQQQFTEDYLSRISFRDKIRERYKEILDYTKYFGGMQAGENIIYMKYEGIRKQQPVYYIQKGKGGEAEVLLDANQLSTDGTVSLEAGSVSHDGKFLTYTESKGGSDWQTMYVMEIATRKKLDDRIEWIKFGGAAWQDNGFYYSRYDQPEKGSKLSTKNEFQKVYYHKLGDRQENDKLIFEDKNNALMYMSAQTTEDERFLFIYKSRGTDGTEIWYKDLAGKQKDFKLLFKGFEYNYEIIDNVNDRLLVYTDNGADNYRVLLVDTKTPSFDKSSEIIPEQKEKLESVRSGGGKLFATYLKDASSRIYQYSYLGKLEKELQLPGIGSVSINTGNRKQNMLFYNFSSFTYPPSIFSYDINSGKSDIFKKSEAKVNPDDYTTRQVFYESNDGTKIPMFIIHKKGINLDGQRPTLLYAYGGFNVSMTPYFSNSAFILLENDGVYAIANIRGGGEYGEKWHKAAMLEKKQNCFDDFIAGAEFLIANKYTNSDMLAMNGGSNGGLLIGAVMTQKPELFKVAIPEVGVLDMLRFHKFTVGWGWTVEYGSSDSVSHFPFLYKYSPLHNIKDNVEYPATIIFTADHDDRVVPAHSFKFAATLQEKQQGINPALIRIETMQGHGRGAAISKTIEQQTDKWSFMFYNMGISPKY